MNLLRHITRASIVAVLFGLSACRRDSGRERNEPPADSHDAGSVLSSEEVLLAHATITGSGIKGEVKFTELRGESPVPVVSIEARITGQGSALKPGKHGMHIHENAKGGCVPPYTSAGGHFDPGPSGNPDPDANHPFHMGDIPSLVVDGNGVGIMQSTTSRVSLSPGPLSVFDENGSVVIVHEKPDQGITGRKGSGVSGGSRIACGVIEMSQSAPKRP